ncbi:hypothetical protein SD51_11105 [Alicyclobacillus tengchongensis]|nr:hypothetical protein SD51_11105 [Alicyclobacillus tengchongensis]
MKTGVKMVGSSIVRDGLTIETNKADMVCFLNRQCHQADSIATKTILTVASALGVAKRTKRNLD